jgi:hypothetical protein
MGRDPSEDPALRARPWIGCQRSGCTRLHQNAKYCSKRCTAITTRARQTPERRSEIAYRGRMRQFRGEVYRMIQRVKVLGQTEDERIVLAWRHGKDAARTARWRAKQKASAA